MALIHTNQQIIRLVLLWYQTSFLGMELEEAAFHQKVKYDIRQSLVANRKYLFKEYSNCFVGSEFVTQVSSKYKLSQEDAVEVGKAMLKRRIFHHVTGDHDFENKYLFYRLREDEENNRVLNDHDSYHTSARNPLTTSGQLLCLLLSVVKFNEGNKTQIKCSPEFNEFLQLSSSLIMVCTGTDPF